MSFELILLFATATATFAFMPGPAIFYVVAATLSGGRNAGWRAVAGLHVGGYFHVIAAVAGLAVLLEAVPVAYAALKIAGAAYLIWIGAQILLQTRKSGELTPSKNVALTFRQSMLVEALNPKAALFYLAFLPQFTVSDAALSVPLQFLVLGFVVNAAFSIADVFYVLAADGLHRRLAQTHAVLWVRRAGGAILVSLGFNLALSRS